MKCLHFPVDRQVAGLATSRPAKRWAASALAPFMNTCWAPRPGSQLMQWRGSERASSHGRVLCASAFPRVSPSSKASQPASGLPHGRSHPLELPRRPVAMAPDGCTTVQLPGHAACGALPTTKTATRASPATARSPSAPSKAARVSPVFRLSRLAARSHLRGDGRRPGDDCQQPARAARRVPACRAWCSRGPCSMRPTLRRRACPCCSEQPRAGGFHLTLAHRGSPDLLSIEFSAAGLLGAAVIEAPAAARQSCDPPGRCATCRNSSPAPPGTASCVARRCWLRPQRAARARRAANDPRRHAGMRSSRSTVTDPADSDEENTLATVDIAHQCIGHRLAGP